MPCRLFAVLFVALLLFLPRFARAACNLPRFGVGSSEEDRQSRKAYEAACVACGGTVVPPLRCELPATSGASDTGRLVGEAALGAEARGQAFRPRIDTLEYEDWVK